MSPSTALVFDASGNPTGWVADRAQTWIAFNRAAIKAIRDAGNSAPIVVNGMLWGSDRMRFANNRQYWGGSYPEMSSLLTFWDEISEGYDNLIPGMHSYWFHQGTDAQVQAYFQAFVDRGLPLIVGEYGEDHTKGSGPLTGIANATRIVDNFLAGRAIGGAAWAWSHNADGALPDGRHNLVDAADGGSGPDIDACPVANATNLSPFGQQVRRWVTEQ
jgi:mannan endo-1,4-beta-mannosidase